MKNKIIIILSIITVILLTTGIIIIVNSDLSDNDLKQGNSNIKEIVDKTKKMHDFACAEALEQFYEDEKYEYYFNCMKGSLIVVKYTDGTEQTVEDALEEGNITIEDLDEYNISYYRQPKYIVYENDAY